MKWDHEPEMRKWLQINRCIFRFMERGIETPVQFRSLHFGGVAAISRIWAARSQEQSQIGTAVAKRLI
jgi:hypothetical protein